MSNNKHNITIKHYDYDQGKQIVDCENVSPRDLAQSLTIEQFAQVMISVLNGSRVASKIGETVGKELVDAHRTLQGCAYNMMLAALIEMASKWSDARNEKAVAACNLIKEMVEHGDIKWQPFI